jgi:hypothetical protein
VCPEVNSARRWIFRKIFEIFVLDKDASMPAVGDRVNGHPCCHRRSNPRGFRILSTIMREISLFVQGGSVKGGRQKTPNFHL